MTRAHFCWTGPGFAATGSGEGVVSRLRRNSARRGRCEEERIQLLLHRFGAEKASFVHGIFRKRSVAQFLLHEAAVVPRIAKFAALRHGVLQQLQSVFKGTLVGLGRNALQRLHDQIFARAAAGILAVGSEGAGESDRGGKRAEEGQPHFAVTDLRAARALMAAITGELTPLPANCCCASELRSKPAALAARTASIIVSSSMPDFTMATT